MKNSYTQKEQYYGEYLGLDKILSAQLPESEARGIDAHDEMLFIIIHQTYELWFKQIMHELNSILDIFQATSINDNAPSLQIAVHRTNRIVEIWKLLVSQVDVLETMTPMDFLDFRDLLTPASGFQSVQFRELETKLGLKMENRHEKRYYEHQLCPVHVEQIKALEHKESFLELLEQWLERIPIWSLEYWDNFELPEGAPKDIHPFWATYRHTYESGLVSEELAAINMNDFDSLFFGKGEQTTRLSPRSLQAALFITLYRDYPLMQMPYQFLSKWLEIDELMANWRYRHMSMVRRMIGMRVGTGGSTGANYLKGAMEKHHIFGDFTRITTYLIPRAKLPKLPKVLEQKLRFSAK
ncbi:tryptophan 2,3-dioxygenase [Aureispira sp. CCB-QB1]|uniref:tryptophan 2,3-dioxygenase n=1 Tax=Aureispira sp. CCB-QB1 TaxID=1313421 RepID=UPI000698D70A|nr:tryptophan 2,3-dioxygenase family protein [Aureispira sp. CCB-QB1]